VTSVKTETIRVRNLNISAHSDSVVHVYSTNFQTVFWIVRKLFMQCAVFIFRTEVSVSKEDCIRRNVITVLGSPLQTDFLCVQENR
jgi:hypothetical protein